MYGQVIVPLDGSDASARALRPGMRLAATCDSPLRVLGVAAGDLEIPSLRQALDAQLAETARALGGTADASVVVKHAGEPWSAIADELDTAPGSLICMASRGRGRSAAFLGSTADAVVREVTTPVVVLGPVADVDHFELSGSIVVCVDGSRTSESILPIAASWAIAFHMDLHVVTVMPRSESTAPDDRDAVVDSGYVHGVAEKLTADVGRSVSFDVLHGDDAAGALVEHARARGAAAIAAATHGHTGLRRVTTGSVTAGLVRTAAQPILTYRPLELLR
jgi:nucleotide-binding universal stress UspA family protein